MMIPVLLLAVMAPAPDLGPMLPPGVDTNFQAAVLGVEEKLQNKDFAGAERAATLLPKKQIIVQWDDSKVPTRLRAEYAKQRDDALASWSKITLTKIALGHTHPDVKFDFVEALSNPPGSGIPAGAAYFWSNTPGDIRLETVIGLKRMSPPEEINPVNVYNEIAAAMGSYFGLTTQPFPGTFMGRSDVNIQQRNVASPQEKMEAMELIGVARQLQAAIQKKQQLTPAKPSIFFDPKSIDLGNVTQGDNVDWTVQLNNPGNAPLAARLLPDCGCVQFNDRYEVVQPGSTAIIKGKFNTLLTVGEIHHNILVNTNDADHPNFMIPVSIKVEPQYRFLMPQGNVVKLPEGGVTFPLYLVLSDKAKFAPKDAQISPLPGTVSFEKWTGMLPDPDMNEGPQERHGYKVTIHLSGKLPVPGRNPVTLWMTTGDATFPTLQANFFAQRGICALPPELYMGDVAPGVRKYSFVISGPAKSFKVTSVKSDWPHLSFETYPSQDGTMITVQATYDGKAPVGPVLGDVTVTTDDKEQPIITVPIKANIQ